MKPTKAMMLTLALFLLVSCSPGAQVASQPTPTPQPQQKPSPEAKPTAAAATTQAASSPKELVAELYSEAGKDRSPFFQTEDRARVDKYFVKATADMIWKDAVAAGGEVGALGADPLYDAQDTDIKKFAVGEPKTTGDKSEVSVNFENFGKKQSILYILSLQDGAWKIADIKYSHGASLVEMLKEGAAQ